MKKSFIAILLTLVLVVAAALCLTACDMMGGPSGNGGNDGNGGSGDGGKGDGHYAHDFGEWDVVLPATCDQPGIRRRYCECGEYEEETINPLGHNYEESVIAPTCTEGGYTLHRCVNGCGDQYRTDETPAAGHTFVDGVCTKCGEPISESADLRFAATTEGCKVARYDGTETSVVILDTHDGAPVTEIGDNAFCDCAVTSVLLPEGIKVIGRYAFYNTRITEIVIPASVEKIENDAFGNNDSLKTVTFAAGSRLKSIGSYAFGSDSQLTAIALPEGVQSVGAEAFSYCTALTSLSLPSTLTKLGSKVVGNCDALETLTVAEGNPVYSSKGNCIIETATKTLVQGCKASEIPADGSVTTIGKYAFYKCRTLQTITIPATIKDIEMEAFAECDNIQYNVYEGVYYLGNGENEYMVCFGPGDEEAREVVFAENVKMIAPSAFERKAIESIAIPTSVETIGWHAFASCNSLEEIEIPASVKTIGEYAFAWCSGLKTAGFAEGSTIATLPAGIFHESSNLETVSIPATVTSVGEDAFRSCAPKHVTAPAVAIKAMSKGEMETVTVNGGVIAESAFESAGSLTRVQILSGVTEIGARAFCRCENLTTVEIGATVKEIESRAFQYCDALESVTFAAGSEIEVLDMPIFGNLDEYENLSLTETEDAYYLSSEDNEYLVLYGLKSAVRNDSAVTSYVVNENVKVIAYHLFSGMNQLESVTLPNGLRSICREAFANTSLTTLTIPETVTYIGNEAFIGTKLETVLIPAGVKVINERVFKGCHELTTVSFAEDSVLESIEYGAFESCQNLHDITIPSGVKHVASYVFDNCGYLQYTVYEGGYYLGNDDNHYLLFVKVKNSDVTEFTLHADTKIVYESAFRDLYDLTTVTIPSGVVEIGMAAFSGCTSLRAVTLPEGLTTLNPSVFNGCSALRTITIPASVEIIDMYAFYSCTALESVTFAEDSALERIEREAFRYCSNLADFVMPNHLQYIGQEAFVSCKSLTSLAFPATFNEMDLSTGYNPFAYCSGLESITVAEGNEKYFAEGNCLIERSNPAYNPSYGLILGCKNSVIPENANITYIVGGAFRGRTGLTKIVIPYGVRSIANNAFEDCHDLVSIELPGTLESIYNYAFDGCYKLIEICNKARYMSLEKGSSDKGEVAYYARNIYTDTEGESKLSEDEDGYLLYTDGEDVVLVAYYGEETELVLPEGVTEILAYAFAQSEIESAQIPASVKKIGKRAFSECADLKTVTFAEDSELTQLADGAFVACAELTAIEIPAGVALVEINALTDCTKLASVAITAGTVFDEWSMVRATALAEICFNGTTDEWLATANGESWNAYTGNYTVICSDGTVSKTGVVTPLA